jgi:DNA-binding NarL/FixJ family response regulator
MTSMAAVSVVVADDQALVLGGLVSLLAGVEGIEVVGQATDGHEALAVIRSVGPDVALVDIRMPGLDGIEVIPQVRDDRELARTRTVVLTTFGLDEYVLDALRAGADGFLVKDLEPDELVRSIRRVADGDAVIAPGVTRALVDDVRARGTHRRQRPLPDLTAREQAVLAGACDGLSNGEIARSLFIGDATVKTYVSRLLDKFAVTSRVGLVIAAYEHRMPVIRSRDTPSSATERNAGSDPAAPTTRSSLPRRPLPSWKACGESNG